MTRTCYAAYRAARVWFPALCAALAILPSAARGQSVSVSAPPGSGPPFDSGAEAAPLLASTVVSGPGARSITVAVGALALFEGESALAFHVDYGFTRRQSARFALEWHLPISVSLPKTGEDITKTQQLTPGGPYMNVVTGRRTDDLVIAQVVPTARLVYGVAPGVGLHVDGGLGIAEVVEKIVEEEQSFGHTVTNTYTTAPVVRLAAGINWDAGDHLRVSLQPLVLSWQIAADWSNFSALLGIAYRL